MPNDYIYRQEETAEGKVIYTLNPLLANFAKQYFELPIYNKKIVVPYFINTKRRKDLRALVGKGTPEEIILETKVWAQVKALNLKHATPLEIRNMMLQVGIGIDCSGFVAQTIEYFLKNQKSDQKKFKLHNKIKYKYNSIRPVIARWLRPIENLNADDLTAEINTQKVDLKDVRPGDLIRGIGKQRNAYHVALVSKVITKKTDSGEIPLMISYIHSHREYGMHNGVRTGEVIITDISQSWLHQDWQEKDEAGHNWLLDDLIQEPDNCGFRRLKCLEPFYP